MAQTLSLGKVFFSLSFCFLRIVICPHFLLRLLRLKFKIISEIVFMYYKCSFSALSNFFLLFKTEGI